MASSKDATALVTREKFPSLWNSLTQVEKEFYLQTNLPKRIFRRNHALFPSSIQNNEGEKT